MPLVPACGTWAEMFEAAVERLPVAVSLVDVSAPGLPLVYVNRAWEELTGYSRDAAVGTNCRLLQGEATEEAALAVLVASIRAAQPCEVTITNYRKDRRRFRNGLSLHPVHDSNGAYRFVVGVASDATKGGPHQAYKSIKYKV